MPTRSREEIYFGAYLLHALGLQCTVSSLLSVLERGARCGLWDICVVAPDIELYVDYDGGYYHGDARVSSDCQKTLNKLIECPNCLVVRIRVLAPPVVVPSKRCVIVQSSATNAWLRVLDVTRAISHMVPAVYAKHIKKFEARKIISVDNTASDVCAKLAFSFRQHVAALSALVGPENTMKLKYVSGIHALICTGKLASCVQKYRAFFHMSTSQVVRFICGGVAARIQDLEFIHAVSVLQLQLDLDAEQLVTFMCDGIAARVADTGFVDVVVDFKTNVAMTSDQNSRRLCATGLRPGFRTPDFCVHCMH